MPALFVKNRADGEWILHTEGSESACKNASEKVAQEVERKIVDNYVQGETYRELNK